MGQPNALYRLAYVNRFCLRAFGQFVSSLHAESAAPELTYLSAGNDTEKISMAPALRMTRSIKEKLPIFLAGLK